MGMKKENDILEMTLAVADNGYAEAYEFLLDAYEKNPENYGPQTFYFLACLAGGADMPEEALGWLRRAIADHGWWYRPEVLEDDDLESLKEKSEFLSLKSMSDTRYADAAAKSEAVFSWNGKTADKLFLAVHGNTQNGETAREDWEPVLAGKSQWRKHWRQYRMKVIRKSSVVVFLPDVICFCGRLHFPLHAVNG